MRGGNPDAHARGSHRPLHQRLPACGVEAHGTGRDRDLWALAVAKARPSGKVLTLRRRGGGLTAHAYASRALGSHAAMCIATCPTTLTTPRLCRLALRKQGRLRR